MVLSTDPSPFVVVPYVSSLQYPLIVTQAVARSQFVYSLNSSLVLVEFMLALAHQTVVSMSCLIKLMYLLMTRHLRLSQPVQVLVYLG
jgi:hypothetical protein